MKKKQTDQRVIALTGFSYAERQGQRVANRAVRMGDILAADDPIAKRFAKWFAPAGSTEEELHQARAAAGLPANRFFR
jgi:hypothetical protein